MAEQNRPDSFWMALEYNFFMPLFMGPWYIYPLYRKDRQTPAARLNTAAIFTEFGKILAMGLFIEFYLHCFPFSAATFDEEARQ